MGRGRRVSIFGRNKIGSPKILGLNNIAQWAEKGECSDESEKLISSRFINSGRIVGTVCPSRKTTRLPATETLGYPTVLAADTNPCSGASRRRYLCGPKSFLPNCKSTCLCGDAPLPRC